MSQLFQMCKAIIDYPQKEMTIDEIIEILGNGFNPHSIKCAMSKIATKNVLVERTDKYMGRAKVYRKRDDIEEQWEWMLSHKGPSGRLILPTMNSLEKKKKHPPQKENNDIPVNDDGQMMKMLSRIEKRLKAIEKAIEVNSQTLHVLETAKPTVVVRKEKR
jgi:DNA-binding transcriptional regulator GbsR (MarR family)